MRPVSPCFLAAFGAVWLALVANLVGVTIVNARRFGTVHAQRVVILLLGRTVPGWEATACRNMG